MALDFGLGDLPEAEQATLFELLRRVRLGAGDVADRVVSRDPGPSAEG